MRRNHDSKFQIQYITQKHAQNIYSSSLMCLRAFKEVMKAF